jgi:nucleoside-triphosphatase THEP1
VSIHLLVVILSGREGTGKSKMCLEIASLCEEEDYMPYKVDGHADLEVNFESSKVLCIFDVPSLPDRITTR